MEGGGGGGEGRKGEGTRSLVLPSHRQPKSIGGGETSPPDLGAHLWVHTEGRTPPPHDGPFCRASELAPLTEANFPGGPSALKP